MILLNKGVARSLRWGGGGHSIVVHYDDESHTHTRTHTPRGTSSGDQATYVSAFIVCCGADKRRTGGRRWGCSALEPPHSPQWTKIIRGLTSSCLFHRISHAILLIKRYHSRPPRLPKTRKTTAKTEDATVVGAPGRLRSLLSSLIFWPIHLWVLKFFIIF